jgi:hypothetical protein
MDAESLATLRAIAGQEAGIPEQLHARLRGESIKELREDARALALDAGFAEPPEPQPRDASGRFASTSSHQDFNNAVRAMAGYPVATDEPERRTGSIGIGVGGAALPRQRQQPDMNSLVRSAVAATRGVIPVEQLVGEGPL